MTREEILDEVVHDAASQLASNANNHGERGQIEFLTTVCGWDSKDIEREIRLRTIADKD